MASAPIDVKVVVQGQGQLDKLANSMGKVEKQASKVQGAVPKASNNIRGFGKASQLASGGIKVFGAAIKSALGPLTALAAGVAGVTAAFRTISGQDFAIAKLKTLGVETDALIGNLKQVSDELNGSASVADLTGAAYDVASAGFADAADNALVLKAAALGAAGGFTDMNTAGNALTSVLNAYGMSADQAEKVMDQCVQTQNDGKIVVAEYAENIGKVASAAAGLKVPLEEVNAAIAQSTAAGVKADVAFTGVKSALARLASGEASKALEGTGLQIDAASVAADGLIGTLKKMKAAGLDTGQIFKALGTEAAPALLPLLNNLDKTEQLLENQANAAGTAAQAQLTATDTIQGAWKQVTTAFENFFADQSALADLLKVALQGLALSLNIVAEALNFVLTPLKGLAGILSGVIKEVNKFGKSFKDAFKDNKEINKTNNEVKEIGESTKQVEKNVSATTLSTEQLADAQKQVTARIQETTAELDRHLKAQIQTAQLQADLTQERFKTEEAINNVFLEQAKTQLDSAKSAGERQKAAKEIYDLTVKQAELELKATEAAIKASLNKVRAQRDLLVLKQREVQLAVSLARAEGFATKEHEKALHIATESVKIANQQLKISEQIAKEQLKQATALYDSKRLAAQAAFEQNKVWEASEGAAHAAGKFARNMERGAAAAQKAASASNKAGGGVSSTSRGFSFTVNSPLLAEARRLEQEANDKRASEKSGLPLEYYELQRKQQAFKDLAERSKAYIYTQSGRKVLVTRPTVDLLNSGAANTIAKMKEMQKQTAAANTAPNGAAYNPNNVNYAMAKYGSNRNAGFVNQQVNVTTGPVQQMDGNNYVTLQQATSMSQSAARQGAQMALTQIKTDPGTRRSIGVGS